MSFQIQVILMVGILICLTSIAIAESGTATFYTPPYVPSACYGFQEKGTVIAAANPSLYNNGAACGRRYRVKCTGGTNSVPNPCTGQEVTVTIVDRCPGCGNNQFDLSQEVFSTIANPDAGRIVIDYTQV
ncbi:EG45-like domain containing protein [Olea europaea var. sylvestris]|uniref:EG45-like domain containing protein n=1 Tax=Olea europaea var. sylvestris TaxID=158386 RepID=UPI000C1D220A|nr:EG45-like domain containing protein [Olea europaea var. sylvestris]